MSCKDCQARDRQRVQTAQERVVETVPPEVKAGERDSVLEPERKKVRFAERVEDQRELWLRFH